MVTFLLFVRPALLKLAGRTDLDMVHRRARATTQFSNHGPRRHFMRGVLDDSRGSLQVSSAGRQESHILGSMVRANCLVEVGPDTTIEAGQEVDVWLWDDSRK